MSIWDMNVQIKARSPSASRPWPRRQPPPGQRQPEPCARADGPTMLWACAVPWPVRKGLPKGIYVQCLCLDPCALGFGVRARLLPVRRRTGSPGTSARSPESARGVHTAVCHCTAPSILMLFRLHVFTTAHHTYMYNTGRHHRQYEGKPGTWEG